MNPSRGSVATAMFEYATTLLGGDNKFYKSVVSYGQYFPFKWDTSVLPQGHGREYHRLRGEIVPVYERFFVGGIQTVRGFQYGEAGPLDPTTGDVIGSLNELYFNAEWIFPIYKPAGLKGFLFFDYGKGFNSNGFL